MSKRSANVHQHTHSDEGPHPPTPVRHAQLLQHRLQRCCIARSEGSGQVSQAGKVVEVGAKLRITTHRSDGSMVNTLAGTHVCAGCRQGGSCGLHGDSLTSTVVALPRPLPYCLPAAHLNEVAHLFVVQRVHVQEVFKGGDDLHGGGTQHVVRRVVGLQRRHKRVIAGWQDGQAVCSRLGKETRQPLKTGALTT